LIVPSSSPFGAVGRHLPTVGGERLVNVYGSDIEKTDIEAHKYTKRCELRSRFTYLLGGAGALLVGVFKNW
jgi:hypothetical protein